MAAVLISLTAVIGPVTATRPDWLESEGGGGGPTDPAVTLSWGPEFPSATPGTADSNPIDVDIPFAEIFLIIAAVVAAWIGYLLYRRVRLARKKNTSRITGGEVGVDEIADDLRKAAEEADDALRRNDLRPDDAIIRAWLTLERAAADSGDARGAAQTPSEFTADLLRHHRADQEAVHSLLSLYEQARFSTRPDLSADDVSAAQSALHDIMRTLATAAAEERT